LDHAVVLGGSLAGLFAAAALAPHSERVTVVERDRFPDGPAWRRGVPQARHAHNLMMAGHLAMERLFPGIRDELIAAGMVPVRMPRDMLLLTAGGWMPRFATDLVMLTSSRDLIDAVVRGRLAGQARVRFRQETEVVGLLGGPGNASVRGVAVRQRDPDSPSGYGEPSELAADLVVDATGRTSQAPQWLRALGYRPPPEQVVDPQVAYATCVFDPPPALDADWSCILLQATPEIPRQGILNPIEGGRWMVSLAAMGGARLPTDHQGFLEFARTLRSQKLHQVLRDAEPVTGVHASGRTENRRRFYERLRRWPDRFVVLGDAVCALNPSYGQGMSVAAPSALALGEAVASARRPEEVAARARRGIARLVAPAWQLATTADRAYPWAFGDADRATRMAIRYLYRVVAVSPRSRAASRALLDVNQMVASPNAVFRPAVLAAVLRGPRVAASTVPATAPSAVVGTAHRQQTVSSDDHR
jgi:2-polyprenyl-6-methoxyphenol hydroxylase-like FAD-dependent oxidoreductase